LRGDRIEDVVDAKKVFGLAQNEELFFKTIYIVRIFFFLFEISAGFLYLEIYLARSFHD